VLAAVAGIAVLVTHSENGSGPVSPSRPEPAAPAKPPRKLIESALTSLPMSPARDGIGVVVLLDTSGSMQDPAAAGGGAGRPKIEIARRAVANLVRQAERFVAAHPDSRVHLGIDEFSSRSEQPSFRTVVPLGPPSAATTEASLGRIRADGGTPIGDALIDGKHKLDASGLRRQHLLVVTDGLNTDGFPPADVVSVINGLPPERRASVYFVAFDIAAGEFDSVRDAGAIVLGASNEEELQRTLDYVLSGKILAEQPDPRSK
jgi:hypothetical protein